MNKYEKLRKHAEEIKKNTETNLETDQIILSLLREYEVSIKDALEEGLISADTKLPIEHVVEKLKFETELIPKISSLDIYPDYPYNILLYRGLDIEINSRYHICAGQSIFYYQNFKETLESFLENKDTKIAEQIKRKLSRGEVEKPSDLSIEEIRHLSFTGTDSFIGADLTVHTSFDIFIAEEFKESLYSNGTFITFSLPIEFLNTTNSVYAGNIGESEINFFWEIPEEFIKSVEN